MLRFPEKDEAVYMNMMLCMNQPGVESHANGLTSLLGDDSLADEQVPRERLLGRIGRVVDNPKAS